MLGTIAFKKTKKKMNNKHSQVLLVFRKNPGKWNYGWSSVLKTCTALIVCIFERILCFDEIFLMPLPSTEQLFIERLFYTRFLYNDHLPSISSNLCKKISLQWYRLYNFPSFRSSHWRCSVRKTVLINFTKFTGERLQQSPFSNKVAGWAAASNLSRVFSWKLFISTEKWNEKRKIPWWSLNIYFLARVSICLTSKISKEIWQMVIWSENVFKGNLMLQFSWLKEFR